MSLLNDAIGSRRLPTSPTSGTAIQRMVEAAKLARASTAAEPVRPPHEYAERAPLPDDFMSSPVEDQYIAQPHATTGGGAASTGGGVTRSTAEARVYDADRADAAGYAQLQGTSSTLDRSSDAGIAAANVQKGLDFYASTFGRNGLDDAGSGVDVVINDRSPEFAGNGAYYATPTADGGTYEAIRFGLGTSYTMANGTVSQASMLHADDLTIHELTHGVIRKETGALGGEADESGATNEAIADVMAAAATRDWRIGEGVYGPASDYKAMRNIANPAESTAVHGLWTHINEVRNAQATGQAEEHWASGVVSTAAARMQQSLGGDAGWQVVEQVFYGAMTGGQLGDMSFTAVAGALRDSAARNYGTGSRAWQVVDQELRSGGI
ncbi:MAG: peptidase family protein [Thermoleophilia bacterium]|nr:peptidase family protein [Thermoleophilia bacterium]